MIVVEAVFLLLFWAWVFSAALFLRNTILPKLPLNPIPAEQPVPAETVQFSATDGLRLEGWKIPSQSGRPWIILCHGVGANRSDLLSIAAGLHQAGFNLFLFDFRGHGTSQGRTTSFGWTEQRDLEGALAYLGSQPEIPAKSYGIYGISMGGAVALMVAGQDERLGAIAADSPYGQLDESLARHIKLMYPFMPRVPFVPFVEATYRLRFGVWPRQVSPRQAAARLGQRPLLLIQGDDDLRMPLEETKQLLAAATGPKELWVVGGSGHLTGFSHDPAVYLNKLISFFNMHLTPA